MTVSKTRLSIIMPAYNEGHHIYANLVRVCTTLRDHNFEVIVVDDGSSDATFSECERAAAEGYPIRVLKRGVNEGKGAAIFHGFNLTSGNVIVCLDSDLEIAPDYVIQLFEVMQTSGAEVVIGIKTPWGSEFPLLRRIMSVVYRTFVSVLFGLHLNDTQTGLKLFRRDVLESSIPRLKVKRFAFDLELLIAASRLGYRIVECPVKISYNRVGGLGRMDAWQLAGMLVDTLAIYYRASFWCWLQPSWTTKLWMIAFVVGTLLLGIGISKILTPLILRAPLSQVFYIVALQFLPRIVRDWLLVIVGGGLLISALIYLNRSILNAFARYDRGDLAGIWKRR